MKDIDLRQIKAFNAIARQGGFSRASQEIGLSQPTLSTHILNLERQLGVKLFDRVGRSVTLTPAGRIFAGFSGKIIDLCRESIQAVEAFSGQVRGELHVEASTVPGEYILPRWLKTFHHSYPEVQVTLTVNDSAKVLEKVATGEVPLGVTGCPGTTSSLESSLLCEDVIILIGAPGTIPDQGGRPLSHESLARLPLIRRESGSGTRSAVEEALAEHGLEHDSLGWCATLGSTRAVIEGALAGLGAAFISQSTVKREIEEGRLTAFNLDGVRITRGFYVVSSSKRTLSPAADRFREELLQAGKNLLQGSLPNGRDMEDH